MEDQRLEPAFADPLPQAGSADEISSDLGLFPLGDIPGHELAAPDIDQQIEVEPHSPNAGGQVRDVRSHQPADISLEGLAVTTHRSVPSSPLVVKVVGMKRRQLSWQKGGAWTDSDRGNMKGNNNGKAAIHSITNEKHII